MEAIAKINGPTPMDDANAIIERVIAAGDLKQLKPEERNSYYLAVCRSLLAESSYAPSGIHNAERQAGPVRQEGLHRATAEAAWHIDRQARDQHG